MALIFAPFMTDPFLYQDEPALTTIADAYQVPAVPAGAKRDRANLLARLLLDLWTSSATSDFSGSM